MHFGGAISSKSMTRERQKTPKVQAKIGFNGTFGKEQLSNAIKQDNDRANQRLNAKSA